VKGITPGILGMVRIMEDTGLITVRRDQFLSPSATGLTMFVVRDTGTAGHTTSGDQATGDGAMADRSGFTAITLYGDTSALGLAPTASAQQRLPGGKQPPGQTERCSHNHFQKVVPL